MRTQPRAAELLRHGASLLATWGSVEQQAMFYAARGGGSRPYLTLN